MFHIDNINQKKNDIEFKHIYLYNINYRWVIVGISFFQRNML